MGAFLFRCPATGLNVQAWAADEIDDDDATLPMTCLACNRVHLVNPKTRRVVGGDDE
jgi:hypothetical protein